MKIFAPIYTKMLQWAAHKSAEKYLAVLSFAESSFFPIPVDVMLAPMALAKRSKAWRYAAVATVCSVLGALFGYLIGALFFDSIGQAMVERFHWQEKFSMVKQGFNDWGVWIVLLASFTPFPYKIVTITAGILNMALIPFVLLSLLGRGMRFFLVAGLIRYFGRGIEDVLDKWVEWIGWGVLILAAIVIVVYKAL
ncbi:MAG: YqaA family protein [Arenicella sp.]